jgi:capsular polysaccharide transport system permease protein
MSEDLRQTRIAGAQSNFEAANESVIAARNRVVELQESGGLISAETEIASIQSRIETLESDILRQELRLQEITSSPQPNATRVRVIEENIQRMQDTITQLRSTLTENQSFDESLARTQVELVAAQNELQLRQEMRSQALQALETARIEANRQALYIVQTVEPVLAETAAYPKSFENTLAAFLVFLGIYLAFSITASVLREQISQ